MLRALQAKDNSAVSARETHMEMETQTRRWRWRKAEI
jgi:hypothetical protein